MIEIYATQPAPVECYPVGGDTDIILRRNIEKLPDAGGEDAPSGWQCEERQLRYHGRLGVEDVQAGFDRWWAYDPAADKAPTLADRVAALEEAQLAMMDFSIGGDADV